MSFVIYRFGPCQLVPSERRLLRRGDVCNVPPKVFDLLVHLVERRGSLVSKQELMEAVWAGVFVEEATLARAISDLRKLLRDGEEGTKYIETVPKFGYRFVHTVEEEIADPGRVEDSPGRAVWTRRPVLVAAACFAAAAGLAGLVHCRAADGTLRSIAVLPFRLEGEGVGDFRSGVAIADTLITNLSRGTTLEVRSINAVRKYANQAADPVQVGRTLQVDAVLEGSMQWLGQRLRLNARLIRTQDGQTLWSGVIEEQAVESFALQDRLAMEVASSIGSRLTEAQRKDLLDHGTNDVLAHQAAMRGRQSFALRSGESFRRAIECFEEAVRRDPEYAEAHSYLAEALFLYSGYRYMPQEQVIGRVRQEARKAIDLNPRLADPHRVLALVAENYDYDRSASEREYEIALSLNPRDGTTRHYYAELLGMLGRFDEAAKEFEIASRLEPTSLILQLDWAKLECFERRLDAALQRLQRVLTTDPGYPQAFLHLNLIHLARGEFEQMMESNRSAMRLLGLPPDKPWDAISLAAQGRRQEALRVLAEWDKEQQRTVPNHFDRAKMLAWTGQPAAAVAELEMQIAGHDTPGIIGLEVDPSFDPLRAHAGFQSLLRRMGAVEPGVVQRSARETLARLRRPSNDPVS